jgi:hypothetical protein
VAGEVPVPPPGPEWRADLHKAAVLTGRMITRHRWFPRLFHTRPPAGPRVMRHLEFKLTVLTNDRHVLGSGLQGELEGPVDPALFGEVRAVAVGEDLPLLSSWLSAPHGPSTEERFELGLGFLLDGIATRRHRWSVPPVPTEAS